MQSYGAEQVENNTNNFKVNSSNFFPSFHSQVDKYFFNSQILVRVSCLLNLFFANPIP